MNQTPLISVGMPTYNRPEGLRIALNNVLKQTYKNLEIIVSDNFSDKSYETANIIADFKEKNSNISFYQQEINIGSVRNFHFLLQKAKGEFFLFVADDDHIDETYIESLYLMFVKNPNIAIAMSAYEQNDMISVPHIRTNLTKYLKDLADKDSYQRVKKYLLQSDHFGKSRLMWGMFRTEQFKQAFQFCLDKRLNLESNAIWPEIPAELKLLSMGNLSVGDEVLFHVNLLPTSDGAQTLGHGKKLAEIQKRASHAGAEIIKATTYSRWQKNYLLGLILKNQIKYTIILIIYYELQFRFPHFAKLIKKIWYKFS